MGSVHVPRPPRTRSRSARAWRGHRRLTALAIAVLAALTMMAGAQRAAFAATGATGATAATGRAAAADGPYGGTAAAVPGTVQAANYDTGGQGVAYNVTAGQRQRQQLPLRRGRPGDHRRHAGHQPGRRRLRPGLDDTRAVVQLHRRSGHGRDLHGQLPGGLALRDHRRAAHHQRGRHQPDRLGRRPEHRRLPDLGHGDRQRHPGGRPADADRRPGLQRLELPLLRLHPRDQAAAVAAPAAPARPSTAAPRTSRWTSRPRPPRPRTPPTTRRPTPPTATRAPAGPARPATRSGWRSTSAPSSRSAAWACCWEAAYASAFQLQVSNDNATWTTVYSTTTGAGGSETFPSRRPTATSGCTARPAPPSSATRSSSSTSTA